jgi:glucose/mannose-6-phosphate isomerase
MKLTEEEIRRLDPAGMYGKIYDFPLQLQDGYELPIRNSLTDITPTEIDQIVVAGMGGSAIGGDLLRSLLAFDLKTPIMVNRNYLLPLLVGERSLVIASSYSGNTEETLAAFAAAQERRAKLFVATTGGKLGAAAERLNLPSVTLPSGFQPRAALGYSFGPLLHFLVETGLIPDQQQEIAQAVEFLKESRKQFALDVPDEDNFARQLARKLVGRVAVIYAGADFYDTTAIRFKGQICENAKHLAYANVCPEFNHNELVGFDFPRELVEKLVVIFLTGPADSDRVSARFAIVNDILTAKGVETAWIEAAGPNRLAEIFSLVQVGDFVSFYLALLNQADPSPVAVIDRLKSELEKLG